MKVKDHHSRIIFIISLLLAYSGSFAQDISGNWQGVFFSDMDFRGTRRSFFLNMYLENKGKKITGVFSNAPVDFPDHPQVQYEVSGITGKKKIFHQASCLTGL